MENKEIDEKTEKMIENLDHLIMLLAMKRLLEKDFDNICTKEYCEELVIKRLPAIISDPPVV